MSRFRLRKKEGAIWPPVSVPTPVKDLGSSSSRVPEPKAEEKKLVKPTVVAKCHAFLQAFDKAPVKKSGYSNVGNYGVIGRGFAATVNLATLRSEWGRTRVHRSGKGRNLVVIGYSDPWASYVQHNMNQEVELLTLPGYQGRPALPDWAEAPRWLNSRQFAAINQTEMLRHLGEPDSEQGSRTSFFRQHHQINAGVTSVDRVESSSRPGFFRFRLNFNDESLDPLIVSKLDICTGTGQQTLVERGTTGRAPIEIPDELWDEYLNPRRRGAASRLWSAEMYVAGDRQYQPGGSVLITSAASPAGIQAGEHALGLDTQGLQTGGAKAAELVLVASAKINEGFPPIGRLDAMVRTADGPLGTRLQTDPATELYPTDERAWFGENYRVKAVEVLSLAHIEAFERADGPAPLTEADLGKVFVIFSGGAAGLRRGSALGQPVSEAEPQLQYGVFDQVIFNTGRSRGGRLANRPENEPGSTLALIWPHLDGLEPIHWDTAYDFPVGLQTKDKRLRVLGAAGINNPVYMGASGANNFREAYQESLPWQARVASEGVTLAALTIAIANGYWLGAYNPCLNTAF